MSFDLGDVVPLKTTVRDADGAPADAGNMALTVTLPDASTFIVPSVASDSPGVYTYGYPTVQPGLHAVRWLATGANACADSDVFSVRDAIPPMLFSLASAKSKLRIPLTSTGDDEDLRECIEATTACVEFFVGPIVRRTVTQVVRGARESWVLHTTPVLEVTAITPMTPWYQPIDVGVLDVDGSTGILRRSDGLWFFEGEYRITFTAGRTAVKPNWSMAARLILQHLWRTNYGATRATSGGGDDVSVTEPIPGLGYAIPNRALQLLQDDRDGGGFA
ncbi:hypothetical protein ABZ890_08345 [Streptomyces sp. NPDC046984]|uniref:hypothetical protein n=1 Tax=Streptomyces sp. NPDC046984 TaxID=3155138 RepID=UPI0033EA8D5D